MSFKLLNDAARERIAGLERQLADAEAALSEAREVLRMVVELCDEGDTGVSFALVARAAVAAKNILPDMASGECYCGEPIEGHSQSEHAPIDNHADPQSYLQLQQQVTQQAATISQLLGYRIEHAAACMYFPQNGAQCDCGLSDLLASIPKEPAPPK